MLYTLTGDFCNRDRTADVLQTHLTGDNFKNRFGIEPSHFSCAFNTIFQRLKHTDLISHRLSIKHLRTDFTDRLLDFLTVFLNRLQGRLWRHHKTHLLSGTSDIKSQFLIRTFGYQLHHTFTITNRLSINANNFITLLQACRLCGTRKNLSQTRRQLWWC